MAETLDIIKTVSLAVVAGAVIVPFVVCGWHRWRDWRPVRQLGARAFIAVDLYEEAST